MSSANAQYTLKLNCDVLVMLTDIVEDRKTLLSFMHTCRFAYSAGIQKLLSLPVSLSYKRDFASFCDFVLDHPEVRPSLIREIAINDASHLSTEQLLRRFLQVLEKARNLQRFTMACGDNLSEAAVAGALTNNTSIKHVTIASPNASTIAALRRWTSPVEKAEISLDEAALGEENENFKPALLDPTFVFASLKPTLQEITTHWAQSFSTGPSFPVTKQLNVHSYYPVTMGDVAHAFPNLARLHVTFEQGFDAEELERERTRNGPLAHERRWESLEYVGGDIGSVYVLALACKVQHLDLTVPRRCHNPETLITTILEATRPPQLTMRFAVRAADLDHMPASLRAASSSVTHLDITYHIPSNNTSVRNFIDGLLQILVSLTSLADIKLNVSYFRSDRARRYSGPTGWGFERRPPEPDAVQAYLAQYDMGTLAQRIASTVPTVRHLWLKFSYNGTYEFQVSPQKTTLLWAQREVAAKCS